MGLLSVVSRPLLASVFLVGARNQFSNPQGLSRPVTGLLEKLPVQVPIEPVNLVKVNATVMAVAGTGLALGIKPRTCSLALAGALIPTTLAGHRYWEQQDPVRRAQARNSFWANTSVLGGLLVQAATPRPDPGRDAA